MSNLPQTPGVYQILCKANGRVYVGSTNNLRQRWVDHRKQLRGGRHRTLRLQRAWAKYGESAFEFQVLELVMFIEDLITCEQQWIDKTCCYDPNRGFNARRIADRNTGVDYPDSLREKLRQANLGKKRSPEAVEKVAAQLRGRKLAPHLVEAIRQRNLGRKNTPEQSARQSARQRGIPASPRAYERVAEVVSKYFLLTPPDGEPFIIKNLRKFCRENGLRYGSMRKVYAGEMHYHKGWGCKRLDESDLPSGVLTRKG